MNTYNSPGQFQGRGDPNLAGSTNQYGYKAPSPTGRTPNLPGSTNQYGYKAPDYQTSSQKDDDENRPKALGSKGDFAAVRELVKIDTLRSQAKFNPYMWGYLRLAGFYHGGGLAEDKNLQSKEWVNQVFNKEGSTNFGLGWIVRDPVAQVGIGNNPPHESYKGPVDPETGEGVGLPEGTHRNILRQGIQDWSTEYGFRFHMNPSEVQEGYATNPGMDVDAIMTEIAKSEFAPVSSKTGGQMNFTILLDRQQEMWMLSRHGVSGTVKYYNDRLDDLGWSYSTSEEDIANIWKYGTMWDLEYFFRTVNGDPPGGMWHANDTSNFGAMIPYPVVICIGDGIGTRKIRGSIVGLSVQHMLFAPGMVPIRTQVSFQVNRHTDSYSTSDYTGDLQEDSSSGGTTPSTPSDPNNGAPTDGNTGDIAKGGGYKKYDDKPIPADGKWHVFHTQTIAAGKKWMVSTQCTYKMNTFKPKGNKPIKVHHAWRRVNWGDDLKGGTGLDLTGRQSSEIGVRDREVFSTSGILGWTDTHQPLAGGGPLQWVVKIEEAKGTVVANVLVAKWTAIGFQSSGGGGSGGLASEIPTAYQNTYKSTGQVSPDQAVTKAKGWVGKGGEYSGKCLNWVASVAYSITKNGPGIDHAYQTWYNCPAKYRHPNDYDAPAGALYVWDRRAGQQSGHIALAIGNKKMISTGEGGKPVFEGNPVGYTSNYLGWMLPIFLGTNRTSESLGI